MHNVVIGRGSVFGVLEKSQREGKEGEEGCRQRNCPLTRARKERKGAQSRLSKYAGAGCHNYCNIKGGFKDFIPIPRHKFPTLVILFSDCK